MTSIQQWKQQYPDLPEHAFLQNDDGNFVHTVVLTCKNAWCQQEMAQVSTTTSIPISCNRALIIVQAVIEEKNIHVHCKFCCPNHRLERRN